MMKHQLTNEEHRLIRPIVEKWIRDLRSGEFGQTHGQLGKQLPDNKFSYCCLGVLSCQLTTEKDFQFTQDRAYLPRSEMRLYASMSDNVRGYVEAVNRLHEQAKKLFPQSDGPENYNFLGLGVDQAFFSGLNDTHHRSFEQIADMVESLAFARGVIPAFLDKGERQ